jgi:hypothetical protein
VSDQEFSLAPISRTPGSTLARRRAGCVPDLCSLRRAPHIHLFIRSARSSSATLSLGILLLDSLLIHSVRLLLRQSLLLAHASVGDSALGRLAGTALLQDLSMLRRRNGGLCCGRLLVARTGAQRERSTDRAGN